MLLDKERCLEAGMDDFVAKPARLEDLSQALQRFLPLQAP
jgi:CheY-like chemotaxis protein